MPSVETFDCTMDAVYWEALRYDGYGEFVVLSPAAVKVRWNRDVRDELDPQGHMIRREVTISCLEALEVGSIVWEGLLADVPSPLTHLYQINADLTKRDVKNRASRYLYSLSRFPNTLPTVVSGTGS